MVDQPSLFKSEAAPEGFRYEADFVGEEEEHALAFEIERLPFRAFQFHGFEGKRRVVSFGWRYDFNEAKLLEAPAIPELFQPLRAKAARFAALDADALQQLLVTEYAPGAAIGWHKDRPIFADVIGVSLLAPCTLRFRRKAGRAGSGPRFASRRAPSISCGDPRALWEHSIPAMDALRYSLTFRSFRPVGR